MKTFKKIDDNRFEKTDTEATISILDKVALLESKRFLEENIAKFQKQLDEVESNLDGIAKAK